MSRKPRMLNVEADNDILIKQEFPFSVRKLIADYINEIFTPLERFLSAANINCLDKNYFVGMSESEIKNELTKVSNGTLAIEKNRKLLGENVPENTKNDAAILVTILSFGEDINKLLKRMNKIKFSEDNIENVEILMTLFKKETEIQMSR